MFCKKCGKELKDDSIFCSNCGTSTNSITQSVPKKSSIIYPMLVVVIIIGLIYSVFLIIAYAVGLLGAPLWFAVSLIIGVLCSIIGLVMNNKKKTEGKKTNVVIIILSILIIILSFISLYVAVQYSKGAGDRYLDAVEKRQALERQLENF